MDMKWSLPLAFILTFTSLSPAQTPRMTVRQDDGSSKRLRIEQADVAVRFLGDIAETVLDLSFRNDGERAVEGEFVLPLPEGATVSAYALDVNGKMRDGVAVEKQRARTAYESVKRRMIDPGIVEREAGNIYRTQVYPVPAKGTKRLRISYTETLRPSAQGLTYALPLDFPEPLGSFSCQLRGAAAGALRVTAAGGLTFTPGGAGELRADGKEVRPSGILQLVVTPPAGPQMIFENEAHPAFFLSDRVPDIAPRARPTPAKVQLVWDASRSGHDRNHTAELSLLEAWLAKLGTTRVSLRLLRDRVEDGGEFEIRGGRWSKLKQALQQVDYDGGSDLSRLQVTAGQADLVVLVSDGVATLGACLPAVAAPLVFIRSGTLVSPPQALARLALSSGGAAIDLTTDTKTEAMSKLTQQPLRLLGIEDSNLATVVLDQAVQPGKMLRIVGTLRDPRAGRLILRYGFDNDTVTARELAYQPGGQPGGIIRRLHAQRVLAQLEQQEPPDPKQIIDHCKRNGLVSDHTSLIVLDRIEDYVEHQIPPPEPELLAEFNKRVAEQAAHRNSNYGLFRLFADAWEYRLHEHGQRFPGYEALLLPRMRQVRIWKEAIESQFAPAQRDAAAFATVAGWLDKASVVIASKPALKTTDDHVAWRRAVDDLQAQGPKLAQTPLHLPPAGQPLSVSVRGLVTTPGRVAGESGMTLRQAIAKAGGLHALGSPANVALYRNAGKIVYNIASAQFQDIQLFPGDMVVAGQSDPLDNGGVDPFAETPSPPPDPGAGEPIRDQRDLWLAPGAKSGGYLPESGPTPADPPALSRRAVALRSDPPPDLSGSGFPVTPATPTGRRSRGNSPPQLPNRAGQPGEVPAAASSEIATGPRPTEAAAAQVANTAPAKTAPVPAPAAPDLTAFASAVAAGRDPVAAYRKLTGAHIYQPDFYVAAARILFARQHVELARRVLSNLAEAGDVATLRSYAYWLAEFGQVAEAAAVLGSVAGDDAATLQVVFDRASILATGGDQAAATDVLSAFLGKLAGYEVSDLAVHPEFGSLYRYGNLAAAALVEFNAARRGLAPPAPHPLAHAKANYRQNLASDIRAVVASTGAYDSLRLSVREPGGFECSTAVELSTCGGRIATAGFMQEYTIRHAVPGTYQISCVASAPATVRAVIHKNWGRPNHTFKVVTLWLEAGKPQTLGEVEYEFAPQPE